MPNFLTWSRRVSFSAEERDRMTIAACPRREQDLLAPFARDGRFHGLVVEHSSTLSVPDPAWIEFQRDKDAAAFARRRAAFFRAVFVQSISQALAPTRGAAERQMFADRLEEGVWRNGSPPTRRASRTWSGSSC